MMTMLMTLTTNLYAQRGGRRNPNHQGPSRANRYELEDKVIKKSARIKQMVQNKVHQLSKYQLMQIVELENQIIQMLKTGDGYGGGAVDAMQIVMIARRSASSASDKVKVVKRAANNTYKQAFKRILNNCAYGSVFEEAKCHKMSLQSSYGKVNVSKQVAKQLIKKVCTVSTFTRDQNKCMKQAIASTPMPRLKEKKNSCVNYANSIFNQNECLKSALN
jgi:hypothetical protein